MSGPQAGDGVEPSVQELYEDAPCGYLSLLLDGTVTKANRTFLRSTGYTAHALLGRRLEDLLAPSSRLYYATHWRPKLDLSGEVREVPADIVCADGSRLAVLINATIARSAAGRPTAIRASLFDATDRRRYERELVAARDVERAARERAERLQRISTALAGAVTPDDIAAPILDELVEFLSAATRSVTRSVRDPAHGRRSAARRHARRRHGRPARWRRVHRPRCRPHRQAGGRAGGAAGLPGAGCAVRPHRR